MNELIHNVIINILFMVLIVTIFNMFYYYNNNNIYKNNDDLYFSDDLDKKYIRQKRDKDKYKIKKKYVGTSRPLILRPNWWIRSHYSDDDYVDEDEDEDVDDIFEIDDIEDNDMFKDDDPYETRLDNTIDKIEKQIKELEKKDDKLNKTKMS